MPEKQPVYDAKVSIRSSLPLLHTIRSKLSWNADRLGLFRRSVFGPWLDIKTTQHDNHLLNFILQHQRFVDNLQPDQPFIFDIYGRTLEYGRQDFCLITGFRFGKYTLDPKEVDKSEFRNRVFPGYPNLKGNDLLKVINDDVKFYSLDDEDAVRVCLLLALDYVFMGHEMRHVISNAIVNLVDDLTKWNDFPWGEYMWTFFHQRDYNVAVTRKKYHLEKLATDPRYEANYVLYGFVFPFKIWSLETFSNSIGWWHKDDNVIPRGLAWSNGLKFEKDCYERLFYSVNSSINKLEPNHREMNQPWWLGSLDFFKNVPPIRVTPTRPGLRSSTRVPQKRQGNTTIYRSRVRTEVSVCTEVRKFVETKEVRTHVVDQSELVERAELVKTVKAQEEIIVDLQRRLNEVEQVTTKLRPGPVDENPNVFDKAHEEDGLQNQLFDACSPKKMNDDYESFEGRSQCMNVENQSFEGRSEGRSHSINVDNQSFEGCSDVRSQCLNVENQQYEGRSECRMNIDNQSLDVLKESFNDGIEDVAVDVLIGLSSHDVDHISKESFVEVDTHKESDQIYPSPPFPSTQQMTDYVDLFINTPSGQDYNQGDDSGLLDGDVVHDDHDLGDVVHDDHDLGDVVQDDNDPGVVDNNVNVYEQAHIKTPHLPSQRQKFLSKVLLSPYVPLVSTEHNLRKRRRVASQEGNFTSFVGSDGNEIHLYPWKEDLARAPNAPKRTIVYPKEIMSLFQKKDRMQLKWTFPWVQSYVVVFDFWEKLVGRSHTKRGWLSCDHLDLWIEYMWHFRNPDADWVMASPYLSSMLLSFDSPGYYVDGIKYGVPWFAENVEKVYFPVNEKDTHCVLAELDIYTGVVTLYDSLGPPAEGIEDRHFWLEFRSKLEVQLPLYMDSTEVFRKKGIDPAEYIVTFRYAEGVPLQGGLYGDCGLWVCIFLYRLSHNIPLMVDDPNTFALAYRERMIEFFWKYKMLV